MNWWTSVKLLILLHNTTITNQENVIIKMDNDMTVPWAMNLKDRTRTLWYDITAMIWPVQYIYNINVASSFNKLYESIVHCSKCTRKTTDEIWRHCRNKMIGDRNLIQWTMDNVSLVAKSSHPAHYKQLWTYCQPAELSANSASYPQWYPKVKMDTSLSTTNPKR